MSNEITAGMRVYLLNDEQYADVVIPAGETGVVIENDADYYWPYLVQFDDYKGCWWVGNGNLAPDPEYRKQEPQS